MRGTDRSRSIQLMSDFSFTAFNDRWAHAAQIIYKG